METENRENEKTRDGIKNVPYIQVQESCCAYREGEKLLKDKEGSFYFNCVNYELRRGSAEEFNRDNICPTCKHSGLIGEGLFDSYNNNNTESDKSNKGNSLEEISE